MRCRKGTSSSQESSRLQGSQDWVWAFRRVPIVTSYSVDATKGGFWKISFWINLMPRQSMLLWRLWRMEWPWRERNISTRLKNSWRSLLKPLQDGEHKPEDNGLIANVISVETFSLGPLRARGFENVAQGFSWECEKKNPIPRVFLH